MYTVFLYILSTPPPNSLLNLVQRGFQPHGSSKTISNPVCSSLMQLLLHWFLSFEIHFLLASMTPPSRFTRNGHSFLISLVDYSSSVWLLNKEMSRRLSPEPLSCPSLYSFYKVLPVLCLNTIYMLIVSKFYPYSWLLSKDIFLISFLRCEKSSSLNMDKIKLTSFTPICFFHTLPFNKYITIHSTAQAKILQVFFPRRTRALSAMTTAVCIYNTWNSTWHIWHSESILLAQPGEVT